MTPQIYGITALVLGVAAVLTVIFKRQIDKALSNTPSVATKPTPSIRMQ
jgi:hypothetical protein